VVELNYPTPRKDLLNCALYLVTKTAAIANAKKITLKTMVARKSVFSTPRRAVKTPPVSPPAKPPSPAPLLCKITLMINVIDVIIRAISIYTIMDEPPKNLAKALYLWCGKKVKRVLSLRFAGLMLKVEEELVETYFATNSPRPASSKCDGKAVEFREGAQHSFKMGREADRVIFWISFSFVSTNSK